MYTISKPQQYTQPHRYTATQTHAQIDRHKLFRNHIIISATKKERERNHVEEKPSVTVQWRRW